MLYPMFDGKKIRPLLLISFTAAVLPKPSGAAERELKEFLSFPALTALSGYQHYLSPIKGRACPMTPSDSSYARQAIHRHGFFVGTLQTIDRLHRCSHDLNNYPLVETKDGLKYSDPVP